MFFLYVCIQRLYHNTTHHHYYLLSCSVSFVECTEGAFCYKWFVMVAEPRKVLPIFRTDEPVCPEGKLSCGNGECIDKELFCNGKPDCKDESDENACSEYFNNYLACS